MHEQPGRFVDPGVQLPVGKWFFYGKSEGRLIVKFLDGFFQQCRNGIFYHSVKLSVEQSE